MPPLPMATTEQAASNGTISIWLDDENISTATVNEAITGGEAIIKGNFDQDSASTLAEPDQLRRSAVSPCPPRATPPSARPWAPRAWRSWCWPASSPLRSSLMLMIVRYRLPGTIAAISLLGQAAATLGCRVRLLSRCSRAPPLTLPGIAGIILGIGMGVDANVITAERIKEELCQEQDPACRRQERLQDGPDPHHRRQRDHRHRRRHPDGRLRPHGRLLGQGV